MQTPSDRRTFLGLAGLGTAAFALFGCKQQAQAAERYPVTMTDAQWQAKLGPAAYRVLRKEGTEVPFTSPLNDEHRAGTFGCKGCAQPLFASKTKFDSGTGWPSFWAPLPRKPGSGDFLPFPSEDCYEALSSTTPAKAGVQLGCPL
jgi:peptide-methionine (R)-S-oxide reductase